LLGFHCEVWLAVLLLLAVTSAVSHVVFVIHGRCHHSTWRDTVSPHYWGVPSGRQKGTKV